MEIALIIGAVCAGGLVLLLLFGFLGGFLGFIFSLVEFGFEVIFGGPVAWCGCLVVLLALGACAVIAFMAFSGGALPT